MADSFNKKEREKKRRKRKQEKAEKKKQRKIDGVKPEEFMYVNENGHLVPYPPPPPSKKSEIKLEDIIISTPKKSDTDNLDGTKAGYVKFYNEEKGFGFIKESITKEEYFVHINNVIDEIKEKDEVVFEIENGPKGPTAVNVKVV